MLPTPRLAARAIASVLLGGLVSVALPVGPTTAQEAGARREFAIAASNYTFSPAAVEMQQDDLVKITLRADDMAHSFTIDEYRISKRVGRGEAISFEFRAERAGRFRYYCNLKHDDRCREMQGELIVRAR